MRTLAVLFTVAIAALLCAAPCLAQGESPTEFNRDLVQKVKRSVIAIWIFQPTGQGLQAGVGIGSGVIFQALPEENAAYALTNHHVAGESTLLQVELWDRTTFLARMVATAPGIDTALIRIENISPDAYEAAPLGDSDVLQIGELALAMGAPGSGLSINSDRSDPNKDFGLHETANMRVFTGFSTEAMVFTEFWAGWKSSLGQQVMTNLPYTLVIQSPINPGNSGGPLFNSKGEVIGLNHAGSGSNQVYQNVYYSVPINFSKDFATQIINTGKYELPWMGIDVMFPKYLNTSRGISEFVEKFYDEHQLKVLGVRANSPAERAGFLEDDKILEFDGLIFPTITDLRLYVFKLPIGKQVPVVVERKRQKVSLVVEVGVKRGYDAEFSF